MEDKRKLETMNNIIKLILQINGKGRLFKKSDLETNKLLFVNENFKFFLQFIPQSISNGIKI